MERTLNELSNEMLRTRDRLHAIEGKVTVMEQALKQLLQLRNDEMENHKRNIDYFKWGVGLMVTVGQPLMMYFIVHG